VQDERWQREVVDPVDLTRDVNLILVVPVNFDEHVHAARARLRREIGNERTRLGNHEAARARLLDRVADGVEPDGANACIMESREHRGQVSPAFGMLHVDIDLVAREGRPQQHLLPARGRVLREGKVRTRRL
jgi:hypothetical protein